MPQQLSSRDLRSLIRRVFRPEPHERSLALLVDLPDAKTPDDEAWKDRRRIALEWFESLTGQPDGLSVALYYYRNVGNNNAELPKKTWRHQGDAPADSAADLAASPTTSFEKIFATYSLLMAPTQFSATAPLKLAAAQSGLFRAATLPGFTREMLPALKLDVGEIDRRVRIIKKLLDQAIEALIVWNIEGVGRRRLRIDLRHREGHASSGLIDRPGTAGNIPSGEAYIVPYEGEFEGYPSRSEGLMPVQFGDELVLYRIRGNRAVSVESSGPKSAEEGEALRREPAYGNLAELGIGILHDFGIKPIGAVLLDEKLGLHIAFGRSDHFGGRTAPQDFSSPQTVVHIDRIYLPETMPRVRVESLELQDERNHSATLIRNDEYTFDFDWRPHF